MKSFIAIITIALTFSACTNNKSKSAEGSFEATEITISAQSSGEIINLPFIEGDYLKSNTTIATIDTTLLALQKEQLKLQQNAILAKSPDIKIQVSALREQIYKLNTEKSRIQNLLKDGAATTKQLDDINSQINIAEQQLTATLSTISNNIESINANAAVINNQIKQIETRIQQSIVTSPIDGIILAKYAEQGEVTAIGRPLLKVADISKMYLRAYVTSSQLSALKIGDKVTVISDYGKENKTEYIGSICWIAQESEFTPKNIQTDDSRANLVYAIKIVVDNNNGLIKIGSHGTVIL